MFSRNFSNRVETSMTDRFALMISTVGAIPAVPQKAGRSTARPLLPTLCGRPNSPTAPEAFLCRPKGRFLHALHPIGRVDRVCDVFADEAAGPQQLEHF